MEDFSSMPGHLARRFQQIAVAIFHAKMAGAGSDLTPVQYAALVAVASRPGIDQATLAGLIAFDRTTIGGVVDRLLHKGLLARRVSEADRRAHALHVTAAGSETMGRVGPAVHAAQQAMLQGLTAAEALRFMRLLRKAVDGANTLSRAPMAGRPLSPSRRRP